jgi:hypothetical protein
LGENIKRGREKEKNSERKMKRKKDCLCVLGESTNPYPSFSSRPLFVCKFRRQGGTEAFSDLDP